MSKGGKDSSQKFTVVTKEEPPPSANDFFSLVSMWEPQEKVVEEEIEEDVDLLKKEQELEEEIRQRGEEIIRAANEEAVKISEEAYRKGFAEGEAAGLAAGKKSFDDEFERIEVLFAAMENQLTATNKLYEEELLVLVTTMVERLVNHEVSTNSRVIQACLKRALAFVVEKSVARVHLHPDDFGRIREASLNDPSLLEGKHRIELMEDSSITEGGCFLETDFGDVDATLEHGREKLYDAVDKAFRTAIVEDARPAKPEVVNKVASAEAPASPAGVEVDASPVEHESQVAPVESVEVESSDDSNPLDVVAD